MHPLLAAMIAVTAWGIVMAYIFQMQDDYFELSVLLLLLWWIVGGPLMIAFMMFMVGVPL